MINLVGEARVSSQPTFSERPGDQRPPRGAGGRALGSARASVVGEEDTLASPAQRSNQTRSFGEHGTTTGNDGRVVPPARLDRTLLRLVVDMNDAEPLGIPERPLVVVEQRPGKVSAQVDAFLRGVVRSAQVLTVILDAKRILDLAVDGLRRIVKRRAVLRDVNGGIAVPLLHPEQNPGERGGKDFPVSLRSDALWLRHPLNLNGKQVSIMADDAAGVIVDPEEIDRLFDQAHVLVRPIGPGITENLTHLFRVVAEENWIKILAIHVGIGAPRRLQILRRLRRRVLRLQVDRDSNLSLFRGAGGSELLDSRTVRPHEVVRGDRGLERIDVTGGEDSVQVSAVSYDPRLVEGRPHLHAVPQNVPHGGGVIREPFGDVAIEPAASVVERFGEVPVVEGRVRSDLRL